MADENPAAAQIAAEYPYLSEADRARALDISNTCAGLMKLAVDAASFPQAMQRSSFGQQIGQLKQSMISALAMK